MELDEYEIPEAEPDLASVMRFVEAGKTDGIPPEQILDETELALYQAHIADLKPGLTGHYDNLVSVLDSTTLARLAQDVVNFVEWDEDSRARWSKRESDGIKALGVSDEVVGGADFKGAAKVVHPLLAEAITDFHSRAMAEIWPPEGPVKSTVLGDKTPDRLAQAQRVEDYMNYQYTEDMPGAFEEQDSLMFRLPLSGSVFKKVLYDPILKKVRSMMIEPSDFIVPFSATDLASAPRYTHRYRESHNTAMKKIASGYYFRGKAFSDSTNETKDYPKVLDTINRAEGRERTSIESDNRHTVLEINIDLELDIDKTGDGVAYPYIVWVDRDSQEVLRIQRNWSPDDEDKKRRVDVAHYKFMPGLGFYGYGLFHLIGGLADAATGAIRALLDSAAFANMQGGFRARDSRIKGGLKSPGPGEWIEVDSSAEELSKAFFRLPYEEPSPVLFQILGYMDERGKQFAIGNEAFSGDASPNSPVGTTLALIEQGGAKVKAIYRRLHVALRNEFRILSRFNQEYLPINGYPYYVDSGMKMIMPSDFDDRVDVIPVSDPSIISNTQRIVQAQAVLDLADKHPDVINRKLAVKAMLEIMRVPNYEQLLQVDSSATQGEKDLQAAETALKQAQAEKNKAEAVETNMKTQYSAIQAAQVAVSVPPVLPVGDAMLASAGYQDANGAPVAEYQGEAMPGQPETNTDPRFPANPQSPVEGMMQGIETPRADGVMQ